MSALNPYSPDFKPAAFCEWMKITTAEFEARYTNVPKPETIEKPKKKGGKAKATALF